MRVSSRRPGQNIRKEMYLTDIENKWNADLSAISGAEGTSMLLGLRCKTSSTIFVIETTFILVVVPSSTKPHVVIKMIAEETKAYRMLNLYGLLMAVAGEARVGT